MDRTDKYSITFARSARKEIETLDTPILLRVFKRIEALVGNPRPEGCRKIQSEQTLWRIRVGDYRVIYAIDDALHIVDIVTVRHRSEAYR